MLAIAGRCTEMMGMDTRMGVWQRFLPKSEAPGPPRCITMKGIPLLAIFCLTSACDRCYVVQNPSKRTGGIRTTSPILPWNVPIGDIRLSEHEVHAWRAPLNASLSLIRQLEQLLTEEETERASRFAFERDRHHFIVARGILRTILGRYLNADPGSLRFDTNAYGKPSLGPPRGTSSLKFNLAHSQDLVLYVFTYVGEVGIDVEYIRADFDYEELAKYSFSQYEQRVLRSLPESAKQQAFFHCWTRREAYMKAKGKGFSLPPDLFDISLKPGEPPKLINSREDAQETTRWSFRDLDPGPGYASALVVEGSEWNLNCWQWQEKDFF